MPSGDDGWSPPADEGHTMGTRACVPWGSLPRTSLHPLGGSMPFQVFGNEMGNDLFLRLTRLHRMDF